MPAAQRPMSRLHCVECGLGCKRHGVNFWNELIRRSLMMWFHVHNTHGWPSGVVIYVAGFCLSFSNKTHFQSSRFVRFALRAKAAWPDPQSLCNPLCRSYSVRCCSYSAARRSYSVKVRWLFQVNGVSQQLPSRRAVTEEGPNGSISWDATDG